ncbi:quaternary ammonium compound efflux SMR transporter SugE [Microbulbifer sp. YPW16]|uniref:quaternary ammonium compound efflux SMR transporter SugE n=1 Tax=Microbulbifer sp. YPW16 TaxID=2904242 RepID=UPI001E442D1E|nr:quaternary ammonium compound efflux SMR transporter SugE [Microbulbifer sp. YPW16]UHQ55345.1 quaternary ammonium compound efflux SMR transporter SugE [Microbulbifer sp. YPW16]
MNWLILILAGLLEVAWATGLKYTEGFTRPISSLPTVAAMAASICLLSIAMRSLPLGSAYAVWVGIGMVGAVVVGVVVFHESLSVIKVVSLCFLVAGVIGLKWSSGA